MCVDRQEGLNDQTADTDRLSQGINNVMAAIIPRLKDFHNLLLSPPRVSALLSCTSVSVIWQGGGGGGCMCLCVRVFVCVCVCVCAEEH